MRLPAEGSTIAAANYRSSHPPPLRRCIVTSGSVAATDVLSDTAAIACSVSAVLVYDIAISRLVRSTTTDSLTASSKRTACVARTTV